MKQNSTLILGVVGPQSNEVTNILAYSSNIGMPSIMVSTSVRKDMIFLCTKIEIAIIIYTSDMLEHKGQVSLCTNETL